ncbi:hypothetical protein [Thermodesulfovibrio hydrogeniphilus]
MSGGQSLHANTNPKDYEAWLVVETDKNHLKITVCCRNNTSEKVILLLKLTTAKYGKSGISKSSQSSDVVLEAGETRCFPYLTISENIDDEYRIQLKVYKDNILIAEDMLFKGKDLK